MYGVNFTILVIKNVDYKFQLGICMSINFTILVIKVRTIRGIGSALYVLISLY